MKINYHQAENIRISYSMSLNKDILKENLKEKFNLSDKQFQDIIDKKVYKKPPKERLSVRGANMRLNQYDKAVIRELYLTFIHSQHVNEEDKTIEKFNGEVILQDFGFELPVKKLNDIIKGISKV